MLSSYDELVHIGLSRPSAGVVLLRLERPEVLNAANERLHRELSQVWRLVDEDEEARVAVVTGAGRAFSAGGDLQMIGAMLGDQAAVAAQWRDAVALVESMLAARKPIVSAINGVAVGAGLAVALLADIPIAAESALFGDGHARLGVAAGDHAVLVWPLLCGLAKAKYYLLTGEQLSGTEAERIGLVSRCVPDDELMAEALSVARTLAAGSSSALQWTKRALNGWLRAGLPAFGESLALEMLGFLGADAREGLAALAERRAPRFPSAPDKSGPTER